MTVIDGIVQDIQADHMTLVVFNTLTTHVIFDKLDHGKYEVIIP